jgi:hypothetical protein
LGSLALKKIPPIPVTRFMLDLRSAGLSGFVQPAERRSAAIAGEAAATPWFV